MIPVRFDVPGKTPMRGYASAGGPEIEPVTITHTMSDGSTATETVWLPIAQPPPASDPETSENEAPHDPA